MSSANKKQSRLLEDVYPELLCGLCKDLLDEPIQVHCPEDHMFCRSCIYSYMENNSNHTSNSNDSDNTIKCPKCNQYQPLNQSAFKLSKFVQRQIGRLRVKCTYASEGCTWKGLLSESHDCEYLPTYSCPNVGCCTPFLFTKTQLEHHLAVCHFTLLQCPNKMSLCLPFLRKDQSKHDSQCASYPCEYASKGCSFIGTRDQVEAHCKVYCGRLHDRIKELEKECSGLNDIVKSLNLPLPLEGIDSMIDDEMTLFHQMFNSFDDGDDEKLSPQSKPSNLLLLDHHIKTPTTTTLHIPKRSSNGKRIRYSKNKQLAHDALRISRQQNPTNDAILNNLNIAKKKASTSLIDNNQPTTTTTTTKPMFILASSYLSNYQNKQQK